MANAIQNPEAASPANAAAGSAVAKTRQPRRRSQVSFQQMVDRAQAGGSAGMPSATSRTAGPVRPAVVRQAVPVKPRTSPEEASAALTQAMARENVPDTWRNGLDFIMHKESRGQIDARNPVHSARGLFQLTRVNYHLNPNGEASFGNGVEEAQGGIRYIKQRYGSVDKAVAHWHRKGWY